MADKRISQLIERVNIANNDVLPIVASGATTTNKVTISTIQTWMQSNLDVGVTSVGITIGSTGTDINVTGSPVTSSGNITINIPTASATNRGLLSSSDWTSFNNKLSSVGLTMPSAFTVSNSPLTANGTIAVTGAGTVAQYIRGDGSLADFPEAGGGGSSVSYYLNGSVSQGTIGGIAYYEMNKTPVLGAGTDFVAIADGYLASFITDAGDPSLLEIPAGNWNFETYFSASSGGGTPTFYIELYKVNSGGTATLIASNSATPELIAFGTVINPYFSTLAVPTTALAITDRLALRYYVARSGRTITMHTENSHLCQIITTFTTGLTALNGLTAQVQNFATGTSGTDFNISSTSATHTFNLPDASASNRGAVTTGTQTFAGIKTFNSTITAGAEVQLVQAGTALPTFIKNISGSGLTSSGSNGIGFNNSNNLYLSGSDKGGAVFSINNTGVRTYTFQDNNGTLALTTDLGSYLPLAGGTMTGAIVGTTSTFTNSGAGIGLGVTNSGSGDGVKITHSAGRAFNIQSSGAGFGVIINNETASTSAPFTIQKQGTTKVAFTDAGAADFSSSVTASSFVKSSGTSAQFLKADGSVDSSTYLTTGTAASTYLPLAGGTLTGALNGTSASFSGNATATRFLTNYSYFGGGNNYNIKLNNDLSADSGFIYQLGGSTAIASNSYYNSAGLYTATATTASSIELAGGATVFYNNSGLTSGGTFGQTERMRITSAGNVGINTIPDAGSKFQVKIDTNLNIAFNSDSGIARIGTFNDAVTSVVPLIINAADLRFNANYAERMRIVESGNVLIGTTTDAGYKLDVSGTARITGALTGTSASFSSTITSTNERGFRSSDAVNGGSSWLFGANSGSYFISVNGGVNALIIADTGAATFSSSVTAAADIQTNGTANKYIKSTGFISNQLGQLSDFGASDAGYYFVAGGGMQFVTSGVNRILIKSTGVINIASIPTSPAGLSSGDIWSNLGILTIV